MVVQRDVEENATVANVLQVFHMAELLHWVPMVVCFIVATK